MKKMIFALACCGAVLTTHGQEKLGYWQGILEFAYGPGTMPGLAASGYTTTAVSMFQGGGSVFHMFNDNFGIGYGLYFNVHRLSVERHLPGFSQYIDLTQVSLGAFPFARWVSGGHSGLFAQVGAMNSLLFSAREKMRTEDHGQLYNQEVPTPSDNLHRISLFTFLYLGGYIGLPNAKIMLGPQLQVQLNNNFKGGPLPDGRYLSLALKAGLVLD